MPFRFSLQAVLDYRQSLEHNEEVLLQAANQEVERARHRIDDFDQWTTLRRCQREQEMLFSTSSAELQFETLCDAVMHGQREVLRQEVSRLEEFRVVRMAALRQARLQREILDCLRSHELEVYSQWQSRQDQRRSDDLFLLRRSFLPRG